MPTRFLHDCRRTAARNLIRATVPERVAMLLTGYKSRAIFDRYNIIHGRPSPTPGAADGEPRTSGSPAHRPPRSAPGRGGLRRLSRRYAPASLHENPLRVGRLGPRFWGPSAGVTLQE